MADIEYTSTLDNKQVLRALRQIESEAKKTAQSLKSELNDLGAGKAAKSVDAAGDKIVDVLDRVEKEAKETGQSLEEAFKGIDKGSDASILALGNIATAAAAVGVAVGAALAAAATASVKFADDLNGAMDRVAKSTNLSSAELKQFKEDSLDVFAGDPVKGIGKAGESIEDVTLAMAELQKSTGLTGEALKDATRQALGLRDNLDIDLSRLGGAGGAALSAGLVSDVTDAFDLMAASQAQFGERAEDVTDTVREYSQDFADLGFNAQTTFNFLSRGLEAGARNTDVLADSLQEFSINLGDAARLKQLDEISPRLGAIGRAFSEGGISGVDALGAIGDEVRSLDSQLERNEALRLTFGSIFENMGETATLALTDVENSLSSIDGAAEQTTVAGTSLAESWDTAMRQFLVASEPAAQVILPLIAQGAQEVARFFQEASPVFLKFATDLEGTIGPALLLIEDALIRIATSFGLVEEEAVGMEALVDILEQTLDVTITAIEAIALLAQGIAFLNEKAQEISGISAIRKVFSRFADEEEPLALPEPEEAQAAGPEAISRDTEATTTNTEAKEKNTQARKENIDQIIDATIATAEAAIAQEEATEALDEISDIEEDAAEKREKIAEDLADKLGNIEIDTSRKRIDAAKDAAKEREDIARDNAQNIEEIRRKNADAIEDADIGLGRKEKDLAKKQADDRANIEKDSAEKRADIEKDFRRELADIQTEFEESATEAIRERDAVAFLRAQEMRDTEIGEAEVARIENIGDLQGETEARKAELAQRQADERTQLEEEDAHKLEDLALRLERELEAEAIKTEQALEAAQIAEERKSEEIALQEQRRIENAQAAADEKLASLEQSTEKEKQVVLESLDEQARAQVETELERTRAAQTGSQERIKIAKEEARAIQQAAAAAARAPGGISREGRPGMAGRPRIGGPQERQFGGPVTQDVPALVGEAGPEIFIPLSSGDIVSNDQLIRNIMPQEIGGAGTTNNIQRTINAEFGLIDQNQLTAQIEFRLRNSLLATLAELQ